jgi:hypothetical protein
MVGSSSSAISSGKVNPSKRVWEKPIRRGETHSAENDKNDADPRGGLECPQAVDASLTFSHASVGAHATRKIGFMIQDDKISMAMAPARKVVQISTMVHPEKDWAFVALCDDGSLWLYHGSWSQIEAIPQTTYR